MHNIRPMTAAVAQFGLNMKIYTIKRVYIINIRVKCVYFVQPFALPGRTQRRAEKSGDRA